MLITTHTTVDDAATILFDLSTEQEAMRQYAGRSDLSAFYAVSVYVPPVGHADNPGDVAGVWVGGGDVTAANGRWLPSGTSLDIDLPAGTEIYALSPTADIVLHVMVVTP